MAINSQLWASSTSKIFTGVLIGLACAILTGIAAYITTPLTTAYYAVIVIGALGGLFALFMQASGAGQLSQAVEDADAPAVKGVQSAFKMMIIAAIISLISSLLIFAFSSDLNSFLVSILCSVVLAIAAGVFSLIGAIKAMGAFSKLKVSETFPAKDAASKLWIAYLLYVIAAGCTISIVLSAVGAICSIVAYVFAFIGWMGLKNTKA
ncbi:MAG: hypothetical protein J6Y82_04470 [Bacteroidales bacterium]|nr:hypothetical protein [Bacteroidales bacterium]